MEPFKHWINVDVIVGIASHFAQHSKEFDLERFVAYCFHNLENLELKARTIHLAHGMNKFLPADYYLATRVIQKSLGPVLKDAISGGEVNSEGVGGWALMAFAEYVALYGQKHPDISFNLLQEITRRGSAEFAIRYFLRAQPELTLSVLKSWLDHEDHHVRRLISEGTRPRLPWGIRLHAFVIDPSPTLVLLENLKNDKSEYVRRSVANHLNDISKDHPDLVVEIARSWFDDNNIQMIRMLRHACRSLLKANHLQALALFGYSQPDVSDIHFKILTTEVTIGSSLQFIFQFQAKKNQDLMIDYVVYHQKLNGKLTPKIFKWKKISVMSGQTLEFKKNHSFKKVTTRKYYPGDHRIAIKVNGKVLCQDVFLLSKNPLD